MTALSPSTEDALAACGRSRVLQRETPKPSVAIRLDVDRWDLPVASTDGTTKFLVRDGATLDEAGRAAARAFAERCRDIARGYTERATAIERALERGEP